MPTQTFINLPVKDVAKSVEFFATLGFGFQAVSEQTTRMLISDATSVMLTVESEFETYTGQPVTDLSQSREVLVGLSAESREYVDAQVSHALAAGGTLVGEQDQGPMYMKAFRDLDGHQWSFIWMDPAVVGAR
jgi:predicted lactoylglutathione lyase